MLMLYMLMIWTHFEEVVFDIDRLSKQLNNPTFIFDDYGHEGNC